MIGAVQEKLTSTSVKAIKKIEIIPVAFVAFESTLLAQLSGSLISNHPKKLTAKITSNKNRKILNMALVDKAFSVLGPKIAVTSRPNAR